MDKHTLPENEQKFTEARRKQRELAASKQFQDDDDSGGGAGKRMQKSHKLEKLLGLIDKGRMKADNFWRFLNKEGLDTHEIKKTELGKEKEHADKVTDAQDKEQVIKESKERSEDLRAEHKDQNWKKAETHEKGGQRLNFQTEVSTRQASLDKLGVRVQGAAHAKSQDYLGTQHFNHVGSEAKNFSYRKGADEGKNNPGPGPEEHVMRGRGRS